VTTAIKANGHIGVQLFDWSTTARKVAVIAAITMSKWKTVLEMRQRENLLVKKLLCMQDTILCDFTGYRCIFLLTRVCWCISLHVRSNSFVSYVIDRRRPWRTLRDDDVTDAEQLHGVIQLIPTHSSCAVAVLEFVEISRACFVHLLLQYVPTL